MNDRMLRRVSSPLGSGDKKGETGLGGQQTETIDLSEFQHEDITESGSFAVLGISTTAIGSLLDALPIPVMCVDGLSSIRYANRACSRINPAVDELQGRSILDIMARPKGADLIRSVIREILETRRPQIVEGMILAGKAKMWGRMHFRSLRISGERLVLVLVEDLTPEKILLLRKEKHERELQEARSDLQRRIAKATQELSRVNEGLRKEIAFRMSAESRLSESLVKVKKTLDGTLRALAAMAEKRDPYTAGHQLRVATLACAIARVMGLQEDRIEGIGIAASIHDIGKICVPAELLSKPGQMSDHEHGIIRAHPEIGYDILKVIQFPWPLAEVALQHHERSDGSGYPGGLKGEDVLLESRIVAVADVVEAMSSHRPYRPSLGMRNAVKEIQDRKGTLYDPEVVDACLVALRKLSPWTK